jgi:transposase
MNPMPAPLSIDLRRRIVEAARSMPQQIVAERFAVGLATVQRLVARERAGEPLAAKPHHGGPDRLVGPEDEGLFAAWLVENPSLTQAELAERFGAETGRPISRQTAGRTLQRMGYVLKKR